jgi:demethylmenaquinone methyltransferase/2-methoxy-6-polyprenyl-1,4-benzoquinol methylase
MQDVNLVEQMNEYYDKRADEHDTLMSYTSDDKHERLMAPLLRRCESSMMGRNVLEVACGTGNWTQLLARRARSVVATDINESVLAKAKTKTYAGDNVSFCVADAYKLGKIRKKFDAAFAADWWSHIPRSKIPIFLNCLHKRLKPGSPVIFVDMLPNKHLHRMFSHYDDEGNLIHLRDVPDGGQYYVVKNFPTEEELRQIFDGITDDFSYHEHLALQRWVFSYKTRVS